jgi:hypothetical protein
MKIQIWLLIFCFGFTALQCEEARDRDLRCILEKTFLSPQMEPVLNMLVLDATSASDKELDPTRAIEQFKEQFSEEAVQAEFREIFSVFSDREIQEIRKIHENPAYEKYMQQSCQIFPKGFEIMKGMFREIIAQNGVAKEMEKLASSFLEITQANFEQEVKDSSKPLVVDVYSSSCPPCKLMEPILQELSYEFGDSVRFVKINCDSEVDLARKYSDLPLKKPWKKKSPKFLW